MLTIIYRVRMITKKPGRRADVQLLYCGFDRQKARLAYHRSSVFDHDDESGSKETIAEQIEDAETADFSDDLLGPVDAD